MSLVGFRGYHGKLMPDVWTEIVVEYKITYVPKCDLISILFVFSFMFHSVRLGVT